MKYIFLFCLLFASSTLTAQSLAFIFKGTVENSDLGKNEPGVTISIVQNGSTISSATTSSNGKYTLKGNINYTSPFTIVFSKAGMVSKKVAFDFALMNEEDIPAGSEYQPVADLSMKMFAERPEVDFSFLQTEPVGSFTWNANKMIPENDKVASDKTKTKIEKLLLEADKNKAEDEAKYQAAIKAADAFYGQKKYEEALAKYEEAVSVKPKEPYPIERINELDKLIQAKKKEELEAQQADSEYLNLIKAADALRDQKKYELAVAEYQKAVTVKDEQYPKDEITKLQKLIEDLKKENENQAKYLEAVKAADMFFNQKSYQAAREKYTLANQLKPSEQHPITRLAEIDKKLNEQSAAQEKKKKYDDAVAAADVLFGEEKWEEAKAKYKEALTFESAATYPGERIKVCDEKLLAIAKDKEKADKIAKLLAEGSTLFNTSKWNEAKAKYTEVLTLDDANAEAKQKLDEITKKLEEAADLAAQEAKFNKLVSEGDQAVKGLKYPDAKTKYEEALLIKKDAPVQAKLDDVIKKIKELEDKEATEQKFQALKAEGMKLATEKQWLDAKSKLTEALAIKPDAAITAKIKEIDAELLALEKDKEKVEKIAKLLAEGGSLFDASKWNESKVKYTEVLTLDNANAEAKQKLEEIAKKLEEAADIAAQEAKFNKLVSEGDLAVKGLKYPEAKTKYEQALEIKTDAPVQAKLDDVIKKMKDLEDKEAMEQKFQALKAEGMKLATEEKWIEAKSKLTEAQAIKTDAAITAKLKEIEAKILANDTLARLDKEYNDLMAEALTKETAKDLDGAIAKYKEASLKKPSEQLPKDKITELEGLKLAGSKQKEIDEKYNAFMKKGKELMAQQKYLDAIKEFNNANSIKPEEKEPVELAAEAERLEKAKGNEENEKIEKILTVALSKFEEKDYPKSKELAERYLSFRPDDQRAKDLIKNIAEIEAVKKNYMLKMQEAEIQASAKQYEKAITIFEQAKSIKPDETKPDERIEEIRKLIADQSSQAEKEALYKEYMLKGNLSESAKAYEQALSHYQNALSVKEKDIVAKDKVAEMQQILDDLSNAAKNEVDRKNKFDAFMTAADAHFAGENYMDAKDNYAKALALDGSSAYAKKQIEECDKRQRLKDLALADSEYDQIVRTGNEMFNIKSYDKAKENYQRALGIRPDDAYPKKKLEEIDAILNPVVTKSATLEDLGDPYDNSIMDGYAALVKADMTRKSNKDEAVVNQIEEITTNQEDMSASKTVDQQATTNEIYEIVTETEVYDQNADLNRQLTVELLGESDKERDDQDIENGAFEHSANLSSQETIDIVVEETTVDYGVRESVYTENSEALSSYNTAYDNELIEQGLVENSSNLSADQELTEINRNLATIDSEKFEGRKETEEAVNTIAVKATDMDQAISDAKREEILESKAELEIIDIQVEERAENDAKIAPENHEEIKVIESDIVNREDAQSEKENLTAEKINADIEEVNVSLDEELVVRDMDRMENTELINAGNKSIDDAAYEAYNQETIKYLQNENAIKVQVEVNSGIDAVADEHHAKNVNSMDIIDKKATDTSDEISMSDEEERQMARSTVEIINANVEENSATSTEKQDQNAVKMDDMNHAIDAGQTNIENAQTDKHYAAQNSLNEIAKEEKPEKVRIANSLGQEYPEGVSQESFTQSDENGLMTAIITRRVVVIEGQGNVYVRTQTLSAVTYSKNGVATTEVTWQRETQGPHLEKHY